MANETTAVKDPIKKMLKARGIQHITVTTNGFGSSGWPDICFLYKGVFVGVECKFGKKKPTDLQEKKLDYIKAQGGIAMLVNETNVGDVEVVLECIEKTAIGGVSDDLDVVYWAHLRDVKFWRD